MLYDIKEVREYFYEDSKVIEQVTTKNMPSVWYNKYLYSLKDKNKTKEKYFRCVEKVCSCFIIIDFNETVSIKGKHLHSCYSVSKFLKFYIMSNISFLSLNSYYSPKEIITKIFTELDDYEKQGLASITALKAHIRQIRKKNEINYQINENEIPHEFYYSCDGNPFIHHYMPVGTENRMIILVDNQNLAHLKYSTIWYIDGTFKTAPHEFHQVYIIHVSIHGNIFPLLYVLLERKTKKQYIEMLTFIKNLINPVGLCKIVLDFEKSCIEACTEVFTDVKLYGCYFHWTQMVVKNMKKNGCTVLYSKNIEFRKLFKMLLALSFIPLNRVESDYVLIKTQILIKLSENKPIIDFLKYFVSNFILNKGSKGYNKGFWSVYERILAREPITNNSAESYNRSMNNEFNAPHPSMVLFIKKLRTRDFIYKQEISDNFSKYILNFNSKIVALDDRYQVIRSILVDDEKYYELMLVAEIAKNYDWSIN